MKPIRPRLYWAILLAAWSVLWIRSEGRGAQRQRSWSAPPAAKEVKNPLPSSSAAVQEGGKLFRQYCIDCHGIKGDGKGSMAASLKRKPADLTRSATKALTDGEIFWRISKGDDVMPSFEKTFPLGEMDRWKLVQFVKSLSKK